jgi:hypothetical protein
MSRSTTRPCGPGSRASRRGERSSTPRHSFARRICPWSSTSLTCGNGRYSPSSSHSSPTLVSSGFAARLRFTFWVSEISADWKLPRWKTLDLGFRSLSPSLSIEFLGRRSSRDGRRNYGRYHLNLPKSSSPAKSRANQTERRQTTSNIRPDSKK